MAVETVGPDYMRDCPEHGLPVESVGQKFVSLDVNIEPSERKWVQRWRCILGHVYDAPAED
jgi:hypothetical protein